MVKYKRFKQTCTSDEDFQTFFDGLTTEGWEIIHYKEESHGQWGDKEMFIHVHAVCKKTDNRTVNVL